MKKIGDKFKESWERTKEKADSIIHKSRHTKDKDLTHKDTVDTKDKLNPNEQIYNKTDNVTSTNEPYQDTKIKKKDSHHDKHHIIH